MKHGTTATYESGCRCSTCVLHMAHGDAGRRYRRKAHLEWTPGRHAPPADLPRCRERCGRLVWHFDLGLCGACARGVAA